MRVRFAPSPTGYLHIGNARTAIVNYLIAKKNNWKFILRIEDTDAERSTRESEESILNDLKWLGIEWDEGPDIGGEHGPYRQSERFDIYKKYTNKLIEEGKAYPCYCTSEELEIVRKEIEAENRTYECPNKCHILNDGEREKFQNDGRKPAIRFKVPPGELITVKDHIKGKISFNSDNIGGDFIIVRSDGTPVYNYIVVIDDNLMEITHVIRGEDHLSNTPKQILIASALGMELPQYAHHALVLGEDRSKLSKRHGITSVNLYRKEGYLPEALVNYMGLLGWATESGEEIISFDEIVKEIDLTNLAKSAAVFDFKKLKWINSSYVRDSGLDRITELFIPYIKDAGYDVDNISMEHVKNIISLLKGYCEILSDINKLIGIFLEKISEPDEDADKLLKEDYSKEIIETANSLLGTEINESNFSGNMVSSIKNNTTLKGKKLFMPIRAIITGRLKGPELDLALPLIGFENCKKRIEYCFNKYC